MADIPYVAMSLGPLVADHDPDWAERVGATGYPDAKLVTDADMEGVMGNDLLVFLRARLDEDEAATPGMELLWGETAADNDLGERKARVLREVGAHRAILELHHPDQKLENWYWSQRACAECGHSWHRIIPGRPPTEIGPETGCPTLRRLAAVYADHPDFREEWKS